MRHRLLGACAMLLAACDGEAPPADAAAGLRADCANPQLDAAAQYSACTALLDRGDLEPADRSAALGNRGSAQLRQGAVTPALRDFEAAVAADGDNIHAVLGRASVLVDSGQLDAAEPMVRQALDSGEFLDRAHFLAGNIAAQRGDRPAAIAAYDAAIAAEPRFASAYANRGRMRAQGEDYAGAIVDYDRAVAIEPAHTNALSGRCWARVHAGGSDAAARADADAAVAGDPSNLEGHLCRGLLQLRAEQWDAARESYDAALALQAGNPVALFGRGVARRRAGDRDGADDMNQARDFSPHVASTFADLGVRSY